MTFASIKATGRGQLRYRLMIEGAPDEWVTNASITHATNADGRNVRTGLSCEGIVIRDRCIMQEAKIEADSISFKIAATDGHERPLQAFTNYPRPIAALHDPLDASGVSMTLQGAALLTPLSIYYLGTETIECTAASAGINTIIRQKWDSLPQKHNTSNFDRSRLVYVYDSPPTYEGRRAYLYAYGRGDSGAGDGTCIWRGIVSQPPRMDSNGVGFVVECGPITRLLRQTVAGQIQEAHPIGIYHHANCTLVFRISYDNTDYDLYHYVSIDGDESVLMANVNTAIANYIATNSLSGFNYLRLTRTDNGWALVVNMNGSHGIIVQFGSPLLGTVVVGPLFQSWTEVDTGGHTHSKDGVFSTLTSGVEYGAALIPGNQNAGDNSFIYPDIFTYDSFPASPLGNMSLLMKPQFKGQDSIFVDQTAAATNPANRIYVDTDLSGAQAIHIDGTASPTGMYKVTGAGVANGANYVDVELYFGPGGLQTGQTVEESERAALASSGFDGVLTSATTINAIRSYVSRGSVLDFATAIKAQSVDANDGDTPFVTDHDLAPWSIADTVTSLYQLSRDYQFAKQHPLDEIFSEELKFVLHYPRLEADGRIGIAALPNFTDAYVVDAAHTIDGSGIVTPADGQGSWPSWEPQSDGLASTVTLRDFYDPISDEWLKKPMTFRDPDSIATHKNRGKQILEIKPYSTPDANVPFAVGIGFGLSLFEHIATQYLSFFSRDYATVALDVPLKHVDCLCGDVVRLTHGLIPSGDGTRGILSRAGVVIERRWNMDPAASGAPGRLTIWTPALPTKGYAPSAVISAQVNTSGTTWTLTCDPTNPLNVRFSTGNDGQILKHFGNGDFVAITQIDSGAPTVVLGTISGTPDPATGTCVVVLAGAWVPAGSAWIVEFQSDNDGTHSTAHQKQYARVASSALQTYGAAGFEQFS